MIFRSQRVFIMLLLVQSVVLCVIFTLLILPPLFKNPLSQIISYPPAIRKRVESLPQYKNTLNSTKNKNVARKIIGALIAIAALACVAFFSGKTTFLSAFTHVFVLFLVVNIYDLIILDFIIFPRSKKVIIPGTEDMTEEYRNPLHHIKGAVKGLVIGTIAALLSGSLVEILAYFI